MVTSFRKVELYGRNLNVVITEDFMTDLPAINKKYYNAFTVEDEVLGINQQREGSTLIIINVGRHKKVFKKDWEVELMATIAHEAFHASNTMMNSFGARPDAMNDEPQAYLLDWIVKENYKTYLKHKEKNQDGRTINSNK